MAIEEALGIKQVTKRWQLCNFSLCEIVLERMRTLIYICLLSLVQVSFAQQDPLYAQFWNTQQRFNPAFTGLKNEQEAHALARWQWVDINGAPNTQLFTYGIKLSKYNSGVGIVYEHDKIGFTTNHQAKLNYAYHLKFSENHSLSFGAAAGINNVKQSGVLIFPDLSSVNINRTGTGFTSDLGVFYTFKRLDAGFSITRLFESYETASFRGTPHYYFYAGYLFGKKEGFQFKPQLFYRTNNGFSAIDVNALISYKSTYLLGLTYRNRDAFGFSAGYTFKNILNLSYTYELTVSKLNNNVSGGSHEIHLGFQLNGVKKE